ncbi:MAG: hypothetical protein EYX74_04690 [Desulfobulbaceae bacterium]|nr:MAG: hypothetical protein EYX74_04690 [Desulfobulbaceae bacterium]
MLGLELRPGSQHSQNDFLPFLDQVIGRARELISKPLLVRLDSAHDAIDTLVALREQKKVSYIIKWNPRKQDISSWHARAFKDEDRRVLLLQIVAKFCQFQRTAVLHKCKQDN